MDEIVDELDGRVLIRLDGRITIDNRGGHRYRSAAKMMVPFRGFGKPVTTQKDSFRHLLLVEPHDRAFCETLIGSPTHPMPTGDLPMRLCIDLERKLGEGLQFTVRGKSKTETAGHDVTGDNKTGPV